MDSETMDTQQILADTPAGGSLEAAVILERIGPCDAPPTFRVAVRAGRVDPDRWAGRALRLVKVADVGPDIRRVYDSRSGAWQVAEGTTDVPFWAADEAVWLLDSYDRKWIVVDVRPWMG